MQDMIDITVGVVAGLFTGALSGFYFERRSTNTARLRADALEQELRALRESIYVSGGHPTPARGAQSEPPQELEISVLEWIRQHQDAAGRVRANVLALHFIDASFSQDQVDAAVEKLCSEFKIINEDEWLRLR